LKIHANADFSKGLAIAIGIGVGALSLQVLTGVAAVAGCVLGWVMLAIAIEDSRRFIVPDVLSLPMIPAGLCLAGVLDTHGTAYETVLMHFVAMVFGAGGLYGIRIAYLRARGVEGLGLGDVKLAAAAGAWLGLTGIGPALLLACLGALAFVTLRAWLVGKPIDRSERVPFGAFLAPAVWLVWMAGQVGLSWAW